MSKYPSRREPHPPWLAALAAVLALALLPTGATQAAKSKVAIGQAAWFPKTQQLKVKATNKSAVPAAELYDINGRRLASASGAKLLFTLGKDELPTVPCAVRVQAGDEEAILPVKGAPKSCAKAPSCKIVAPTQGAALQVGVSTHFEAVATSKDKNAQPLKYEWDFAGGAMGHPTELMAMPTFIRDNSRYRVRFSATDARGRRCEDSVEVVVGTPPTGLPAKVAEQAAPRLGNELTGTEGDTVVLPVENWTYQCGGDQDFTPNQQVVFNQTLNNLTATVYQKARLPVILGKDTVDLRYSAASNPTDPAGSASINSTSRNWNPALGANVEYLRDATVQKTDLWDRVDWRGDGVPLAEGYISRFWGWQTTLFEDKTRPWRDEGYLADVLKPFKPDDTANPPEHGAFMPGFEQPYAANTPQAFQNFDANNGWFVSGFIPITDIDDQGRVNPFPLMRVEALKKSTGESLAATDAVMTAGRDHHCRECHAKGKIGANPATPWTEAAFHYSVNGRQAHKNSCEGEGGGHDHNGGAGHEFCTFAPPKFFDPASPSLRDQEDAAFKNIYSLHDFYDGFTLLQQREKGILDETGKRSDDGSFYCSGCHISPTRFWPMGMKMWDDYFEMDETDINYWPNYTLTMHKFHGRLQRDPGNPDQILREASGVPKLWDPTLGENPNSLFPVRTAGGESRPMEENCLQCHAGQRESCYRDRMYTAGRTCYDCHGDMLAQGTAYEKSHVGPDGNKYRVAYYDEPDCGSCHTGDANDSGNGFFSAGVMKRAFDEGDRSATSRPPRRERFAVQFTDYGLMPNSDYLADTVVETPVRINERVYRDSKDKHGNVACGACHGGAHAVWPNQVAGANDNVTALQLQGHAGNILECNVCHTADSFKLEADLDGGQYSGDSVAGILGGPHNLHPVNDPYWWKEAPGDAGDSTPNRNGKVIGGWHNNYAKKPGANGEDQCAACHGADHKGTRLSKTPVDREFINEKGKKVSVAAGTVIGCDLCHSLEKSFTGSPGH